MKAVIRYYGRVLGPLGLELDALLDEVVEVKDRADLVEYLKRMALPLVAAYAHVFVEDDEKPAFAVCDDGSIRDLVAGEWIVEPPDDEE